MGVSAAAAPELALAPAALVMALGVWWGSNTIAHLHLHRPLFAGAAANRAMGLWLTLLTGIPQSVWRARHLAHHAGDGGPAPPVVRSRLVAELGLLALAAVALALSAPGVLVGAWLPGWLVGLGLCRVQGRFEHELDGDPVPAGVSTYGWLYNKLWFNDGYHAEHHRTPGAHWSTLPSSALPTARTTPRPPVLRAARVLVPRLLGWLEGLLFGRPWLQRFVLAQHRAALKALAPRLGPVERVAIVGGGLFPRTAILLSELWPDATLTLIDANPAHLDRARSELARRGLGARAIYRAGRFEPQTGGFDLVVVPLAYEGDRDALYRSPTSARLLIHDWIWRPRGQAGVRVAWLCVKRLNLVTGSGALAGAAAAGQERL
jgi:hypothetical protein